MKPNQEVVIIWLDERSSFKEASLEAGDVILRMSGEAVENMESFVGQMISINPDQKIPILALDHPTGNIGAALVEIR